MRARNPSSISFSFLVGGWSRAFGFGGGPKLGRGLLIVELCLFRLLAPGPPALVVDVPTVETLSLARRAG